MLPLISSAIIAQPNEHASNYDQQLNQEDSWDVSSQWLYSALSARFADHAGDYQAAMETIGSVAKESGQYEAFSYSYYLALDTLQLAKAESIARQWLRKFPNDSEAQEALLTALLRNEKNEAAFEVMVSMLNNNSGPETVALLVRLLTYSSDGAERLSVMRQLSALYPKNPFIWYYRGLIAKEIGQIVEAIDAFDEALSIDVGWRQVKLLQAEALSEVGDLSSAQALMQALYDRTPADPLITSTFIDIYVDHYQWEDALALANHWQTLSPDDDRIRHLIAWLSLNAGHYAQAVAAYRALLDDDLIDVNEYYFQTAKAAEAAEKYEIAEQSLRLIDAESTLYMFARQNCALISFKRGKIQTAMAQFDALREEFSDYRLEMYLVELHHLNALRAYDLSRELLTEALKTFPDQVDLLYALAEWQTINGSAAQAERTYKKILAADPGNIDALNAYGYLLLTHTMRIDAATEMITKAIEAYPDSPAIQDSYGWLLYEQGKVEEALTWVRRAYSAYRKNDITPHYIELLMVTGQKALAKDIYQSERIGQPDNLALITIGQKFGLEQSS